MENSKIKNIIIAILLTLNMFFLALFLMGRSETGKLEQQAKEDILSIYSASGISIDISVIPQNSSIGYYKTTRDLDSEKQIAETVLGAKDMTALESNVYQYLNILGSATFYPLGDFTILLTSGKEFSDTSTSALLKFFKEINTDVDIDNMTVETSGDSKTLIFYYLFNKVRVLNATLSMKFEGDKLLSLTGKRPISTPLYTDATIMNVNAALINFLDGIKSIDPSCTRVTAVSAAYFISDSDSGSVVLLPVWRIETNSGNYYVNGLSGKVSAISD